MWRVEFHRPNNGSRVNRLIMSVPSTMPAPPIDSLHHLRYASPLSKIILSNQQVALLSDAW
jgi:hypothetical protein